MRTLRSSELGTYLYCERAWWYQQQGVASINTREMAEGASLHEIHGRRVRRAGMLKVWAWLILFSGMAMLIFGLVSLIL